jgi:cytochrome c-type biogenesis protein CcsB
MMLSILQRVLMPISFGSLFSLMLLYWGQAALFSYTKYSKLTSVFFSFSFVSLTTLLLLRWVDSGHFPLSNLYESLLFLSWSFLGIQLIAQLTLIPFGTKPDLLNYAEPAASQIKAEGATTLYTHKTLFFPSKARLPSQSQGWPRSFQNLLWKNPKLFISSQQQLLHLLGVITSPMALLTYGFAFLNLPREMQKATALVPALQSNWLMMHVTIMILSYAALLCGSIFSMVFLLLTSLTKSARSLQTVQDQAITHHNQIRVGRSKAKLHLPPDSLNEGATPEAASATDLKELSRHPSDLASNAEEVQNQAPLPLLFGVNRRPHPRLLRQAGTDCNCKSKSVLLLDDARTRPLELYEEKEPPYLSLAERLDNYSYRVLALGFPLLTIGILSGAVWANEAWGSYWSWDPKETWALITWLVFAIYLHARILKGWTGRKPAIIATFGFFVVWFCYLGVNLLGTGLHSYGWFSN